MLCAAPFLKAQTAWKAGRSGGASDLVAVFFTSSERGFVAGDKGFFTVTTDGGKSWRKQFIQTEDDINEIYFRNDDNGYIVAGKKMFLTDDGGRSWRDTRIYKAGDFKNLTPQFLSIRYSNKKRGLIVGSLLDRDGDVVDSLVMLTDDGGETWTRILVPSKTELYHLDFADNANGWIVGDKGLILVTYDGGVNWQIQKSGTDKALFNVDFRDSREGYAVGGRGTILRTVNGGGTWETVKTNFPSTFLRVDFADDKNGWIVGYGGTILRSSDKGRTWIKQDSGTKENLYGLFMTKKYGWAVGAKGLLIQYQK
jgi:photosystem II stability/assembly factor-like uncharacterized protein